MWKIDKSRKFKTYRGGGGIGGILGGIGGILGGIPPIPPPLLKKEVKYND